MNKRALRLLKYLHFCDTEEKLNNVKIGSAHLKYSTGFIELSSYLLKGAISGLRQSLAIESPVKKMRNAFYFNSKALFILKTFKFLS